MHVCMYVRMLFNFTARISCVRTTYVHIKTSPLKEKIIYSSFCSRCCQGNLAELLFNNNGRSVSIEVVKLWVLCALSILVFIHRVYV